MKNRVVRALITSFVVGSFVVTPVFASPSEGNVNQQQQAEIKTANAGGQLEDLMVQISTLKSDMEAQQAKIAEADQTLAELEQKEKEQYEKMKLRIKYLYEEGDASFVDTVLSTKSYTEFVNKVEYFQQVHKYDREKLQEYTETKEQIASVKAELESGQAEIENMLRTYESQQASLAATVDTVKAQSVDATAQIALAETNAQAQVQKLSEERQAVEQQLAASETDKDTANTDTTPVVDETPVADDTPVVDETPVADETPVVDETPVADDTPVVDEAPVVDETPVVNDTPVVEETPVVDDAPVVEDTPSVNDTPVADDTPVVEDTPSVNDTPVINDTPVVDDTPIIEETPVEEEVVPNVSVGEQIANTGLGYKGNLNYVWGGTSLVTGADCSGFTQAIFANYGISIPRTAEAQWAGWGQTISYEDALPGDLVCYSGHVGIYIGNGQLVHASNERDGVKVSPINYRQWLGFKRYW